MKRLLLAVVCAALAFAQARKSFWLIRIEPARESFIQSMTDDEKKIMGDHFEYLKGKLADGSLVLAGPAMDAKMPVGIILVETATRGEAEAIANGDPSVKSGVQKAKVYPFTMALARDKIRQ